MGYPIGGSCSAETTRSLIERKARRGNKGSDENGGGNERPYENGGGNERGVYEPPKEVRRYRKITEIGIVIARET